MFRPVTSASVDGQTASRILCLARFAPEKAHHILIEVVARLVATGRQNIRLTLVGDGPLRAAVERVIASCGIGDYVNLAGRCNPDGVLSFYRNSDIFVLPSFSEGLPVALMEAMAMGLACVSTWSAGIPELSRNEIDGLLVAPADRDSLYAAISRLLDDSHLRDRLSLSARKRVEEHFDLQENTRRLGRVFCSRLTPNVSRQGNELGFSCR